MSNITKRAIQHSFIKLLNQKTIDKITVKDIVEDCGINRNTFYYHYADIFDLLQDVFNTEILSFDIKTSDRETWKESFTRAVDFSLKNKKAVYHVFNSSAKEMLEKYLWELSGKYTETFVKAQAVGLNVSPSDLEYVIVFYKHAFMGIVIEWLINDMKTDPMEAIGRYGFIFDGNIRQVLEKLSKDTSK